MEQFLEKNQNPVMSVGSEGTVLYSNEASEPLLQEWGVKVGEKLPSSIGDIVQKVIIQNNPEKMEVRAGKRVYLVVFNPLPKQESVNISGFDITDQKELEGKLRESEVLEMTNLELADIIDIEAVQSLMNDFYKLAHITMALVDLKGNVLVGVGWKDICTKFHRVCSETCKHCMESDTKLSSDVSPGEFKLYKCKNNMWDIATPIIVGEQHVGNAFSGQFFFEDELVDYELFRSQARKYGFNEEEYINALEKVPRLSREAVDTSMSFLMTFANMVSQLGYSNLKLAKSLVERDVLVDALQESGKREQARSEELEVLLDAVPVSVYIAHDPQALRITGNRLSYEWLRVPVGTNFSKSAPEEEKPEMFKLFKDEVEIPPSKMPLQLSATGIEINDCELDIVSADGQIRHILGNARPLRDEQGNLRGSISAFIDITERKKAEEALKKANDNLEKIVEERTAELEKAYNSLKESEKGLAEAQKMANIGNWDLDFVTGETYWSDEMYRIFGHDPQELVPPYNEVLNYVHPDDRDYVDSAFKKAMNGKLYSIHHRIVLANGEERTVHTQSEVIFNEKNIPIRIKGIVQDITESKKAEEKIKILANAVESSNDAIITESLDGIITSWNKGAEQVYGYSAEEILGKHISNLAPPYLDKETKKLAELVKQGEKVQQYETLRLRKDGEIINVSVTFSPIFDTTGKLIAISVIYRDITKRKKAEEALRNFEIIRKKELHHRIKNNLQVISSLLDLQADLFKGRKTITDSEVLKAFKESIDRVLSIALIHEELYKGKNIDLLNFSQYIKELANNLLLTYSLKTDVSLNFDLDENIFFDMDTAIPLGIAINEIVSNSFKYAFSGRDKGEIKIKLHKEENGEYETEGNKSTSYFLSVSDNGVGIPEYLNIEDLDSLGLQLVISLVDQLDGELELKRNNGTEFAIRFTVREINDYQ